MTNEMRFHHSVLLPWWPDFSFWLGLGPHRKTDDVTAPPLRFRGSPTKLRPSSPQFRCTISEFKSWLALWRTPRRFLPSCTSNFWPKRTAFPIRIKFFQQQAGTACWKQPIHSEQQKQQRNNDHHEAVSTNQSIGLSLVPRHCRCRQRRNEPPTKG